MDLKTPHTMYGNGNKTHIINKYTLNLLHIIHLLKDKNLIIVLHT